MRRTLLKNRIFLLPYALLFCAACFIIGLTDKIQLHQYFNSLLRPSLNGFFEYITYLGDGIFVVAAGVLLLILNVRKGLTTLLAYGLSAGFTQGIKYAFFADVDRPELLFEKNHLPLKLVEGVDINIHNSFPSGHATAAFALFFCLSFLSEKVSSKIIFFLIALTVAFSRVYLSQHFLEDITAGSFIAVCFSSLVCWFFYFSKASEKFDKLDKPLYRLF
ncbi:MAG TPA: phosphatase PAP2 family protein [Bacteroidia bacterium]|nr:phosphatase PAP2 family protein [Bacteroidia bacterium]